LPVHEPTDPILATIDASTPQHLLDAPRTIGPTTLQKNKRDLFGKLFILLTPLALVLLRVIVQAAATDSQSQAHFRGPIAGLFGSHLGDHFVEFGGS
jgi:hypothetical protein